MSKLFAFIYCKMDLTHNDNVLVNDVGWLLDYVVSIVVYSCLEHVV